VRVLIVGAGISGLFIAYELAMKGVREVVVVDKSYPGSGASLRNVACFRSSFTSPEHVLLMKESIKKWLELKDRLNLDIEQSGYLWVARKPETLDTFRKLVSFYHSYEIPAKILNVDEVKGLVPKINSKIISGAMFDPTAGKMGMLKNFVKIYLETKKAGVKIIPYTEVKKLIASNDRVVSVETSRGVLEADVYVVAAAGDSKRLLEPLGVHLPIKDVPRHPMITEPYAADYRLGLLIDWDTPGSPHITQTVHGGFILARDLEDIPEASLYSPRSDAFKNIVKPLAELLPFLKHLKIVRYWMGYYDMTPDHHPIYGPVEQYTNLFIAAGFSGHGMMLAPVTGEVISSWIIEGKPSIPVAQNLTLERFKTGKLVRELAVIG